MQTLAILLGLVVIALGLALFRQRRSRAAFLLRMQDELGSASSSEAAVLGSAAALQQRVGDTNDEVGRLRSALDASPLGMVIVDSSGEEVFANEAAAHYAEGLTGDAVVGIRLRELIQETLAGGVEAEEQVEVLTPPPQTIQLKVSPLQIDGRRLGALAFAHDVTGRSEVDTIRRDFVANASHELKTPLGALRLLAEALVTTSDRETQESLSQRIQIEATRMTKLVEDILDLALIEEHQEVRSVVELSEVIAEAVDKARLVAETLGVEVTAQSEKVAVVGDRRRLTSAVANLLENAINYTAAKGAESPAPIEIRVFRVADQAVVEVQDHGLGIAERHQPRIFERFYRVDKGRDRASGGTGLGLAIVRHVVENHRGEVEVTSTPGEGSMFRIILPARED